MACGSVTAMKRHAVLPILGLTLLVLLPCAFAEEELIIKSRTLEQEEAAQGPAPGTKVFTRPVKRILIGVNNVYVDSPRAVGKVADLIGEIGAVAARVYPDHVRWGAMQRAAGGSIDFDDLDAFVGAYQRVGFGELIICLKSHAAWAARLHRDGTYGNPVPKPEYMGEYAAWVGAVVERYDGDGELDMPELLRPVRIYEIGSELSAEEPEAIEEYLEMLGAACAAARAAYSNVQIAHAAFLTTGVFDDNPSPDDLEWAFGMAGRHLVHKLGALRTVLDAHHTFDLVNLHAVGNPYEIEQMVPWIRRELEARGTEKPIIISECRPFPYIAWGPATTCTREKEDMGRMIPPATEADRCAIADFFRRLVGGEDAIEERTYRMVASDIVKRVVIAAEQDVTLIVAGDIQDRDAWKRRSFEAAMGTGGWGGMIDLREKARRPGFFALNQAAEKLAAYHVVKRIKADSETVRIYRVERPRGELWIAWLEPPRAVLPGEVVPTMIIDLPVQGSSAVVERMVRRAGDMHATRKVVTLRKGVASIKISPSPSYIYSSY